MADRDFSSALVSFGKLIGLMDTGGTAQWTWCQDPLNNSLKALPANREQIGDMLRYLLPLDAYASTTALADKEMFDTAKTLRWEHFDPASSVKIGIVWNKADTPANTPLTLGLAGRVNTTIASQPMSFGLLASAIQVENGTGKVTQKFGQFAADATIPVPDFLGAASLTASYTDKFSLSLSATDKSSPAKSKTMSFSVPAAGNALQIAAWDAARIAAFVVQSWVAVKDAAALAADPNDKGVFYRIDKHLFPALLAESGGSTHPLPPLDATGALPNWSDWTGAVLSTSGGASTALTVLWHLRALVTGNESANVLSGSYYFPLVADSATPTVVPPTSFPPAGPYPPVPDKSGAWLGFTYGAAPSDPVELALYFRNVPAGGGATQEAKLRIARFANGALERPQFTGSEFSAISAVTVGLLPLHTGNALIDGIDASTEDGGSKLVVKVFTRTVTGAEAGELAPVLGGDYVLSFVVRSNGFLQYRVKAPFYTFNFPLEDAPDPVQMAADLVTAIVGLVLSRVLNDPQASAAKDALQALLPLIQKGIKGQPPGTSDILTMVKGLGGAAANAIGFGDNISIDLSGNKLTPKLSVDVPEDSPLKDTGLTIGSVNASVTIDPTSATAPVAGFSLGFKDVRIGQNGGQGDGAAAGSAPTGIVAKLFPDLRNFKGFDISVSYTASPQSLVVEGGGKIPIQRALGPLELVSLLVEFRKESFSIGVDLFFQLGPITVVVYEMGVTITYSTGKPEFFLHGLGVSFDGGGIKLTGLFLEFKHDNITDYIGGAVIGIESLFQISAIGGYANTPDGASLFIFASLVAPLGGPPFFFVTGIAGGFGYQRTLPPVSLLSEHPFLKVMRGEINFDGDNPTASLTALATAFSPQAGQYWIAAGIQFTCFAVINGKVIVAVSFGKKFSFNLLGMLSYGIAPVAYFELDFMVTADEEHFLLVAGMGPNSYLIDPDIFSLQGQFGMGVWYATGDFVISVGGYHPAFPKPDHYPELARVGVKAIVYDFVHVDVQCFFACTPQALMAGASVSLYADFDGISAGLDLYVDVLIMWDPFFLLANMGVTVWFHFMGRHEIGVDLTIWTPPFGGKAKIEIFVVSFTVSFGSSIRKPLAPKLHEFIAGQLGVPATGSNALAAVAAFNTASSAGMFRVDVTDGRAVKKSGDDKVQEGVTAPIPVNAEFAFTVTTKMPLAEYQPTSNLGDGPNAVSALGETDLPLCGIMGTDGKLRVSLQNIAQANPVRLVDFFPAATFGEQLAEAQADSSARDLIGGMKTDTPSIPLTDGFIFTYTAKENGASGFLAGTREEYSTAAEDLPLPIAWTRPILQTFLTGRSKMAFAAGDSTVKFDPRKPIVPRRMQAALLAAQRTVRPVKVTVSTGDTFRNTVMVSPRSLTVNTVAPGVATVGVPASPVRRPELLPVSLRLSPVVSPAPARRFRIPLFTQVLNLTRVALRDKTVATTAPATTPAATAPAATTPATTIGTRPIGDVIRNTNINVGPIVRGPIDIGPLGPIRIPPILLNQPDVTVTPQKAGHIAIDGGDRRKSHTLTTKGDATLRTIYLDAGGRVLADRYTSGAQTLSTPAGTADVMLLHQGTLAPLAPLPATVANLRNLQVLTQNIGIESDTMAIAMGPQIFAGHGCVLVSEGPLPQTPGMFDTLSGAELLAGLTAFSVALPALARGCTLVLIVQPTTATPDAAVDNIRWGSDEATLSALQTVVSTTQTAFICTVEAPSPWELDIDLGEDWRVASVVLTAMSAADMAARLRTTTDWDLIDDRVQTGANPASIDIDFEVAK